MTSYRAYTFHIDTTGSKNSKKDIIEKQMQHGEFMTFENENLNEMRVWLYNADEPPIENKVLHSFTRSSEKYAIDAFMNDLDMNYNFPLNGYITSPSIKKTTSQLLRQNLIMMIVATLGIVNDQTFRSLLLACTITLAS